MTAFASQKAQLEWLATTTVACPLRDEHSGNCLLEVAEKMSKALGMKTIKVEDDSGVKCKENKMEASLRRLRVYQGKLGWYEGHDYKPKKNQKEIYDALKEFVDYPLASLMRNAAALADLDAIREAKNVLQKRGEEFLKSNREAKVSQFMAWLWEADCDSYVLIDNFMKPVLNGLEITSLYKDPGNLVKNL
jgi:hypothetical protein